MKVVEGCSKVVEFLTLVSCQSCSEFIPLKFFPLIEISTCLCFLRPKIHITVCGFVIQFLYERRALKYCGLNVAECALYPAKHVIVLWL
jgi:hypothetical protein